MTDTELGIILKCIDAALDVFREPEGKLTAPDVSIKSMLRVMRSQVADQLSKERASPHEK